MNPETRRTLAVATTLCLVCSVLVSTAAVVLRPRQQANKKRDIQKNILEVAGIYKESVSIDAQFRKVQPILVLLPSGESRGEILTEEIAEYEGIDLQTYDARKAAKDPKRRMPIPAGALPQIANREPAAFVYEIRGDSGDLEQVVLPIYGKGLWSTLYGFIALKADGTTIQGITFYEHGETPGLGGEVDNKKWKASWNGKLAFGEVDGRPVEISIKKGLVVAGEPTAPYQVDGLSGATITSNGVTALVQYWLGPHGFGPYIEDNLRAGNGSKESSDG